MPRSKPGWRSRSVSSSGWGGCGGSCPPSWPSSSCRPLTRGSSRATAGRWRCCSATCGARPPSPRRPSPRSSWPPWRSSTRSTGQLVNDFDATVGHFAGDGFMVFFNDPMPCDRPGASGPSGWPWPCRRRWPGSSNGGAGSATSRLRRRHRLRVRHPGRSRLPGPLRLHRRRTGRRPRLPAVRRGRRRRDPRLPPGAGRGGGPGREQAPTRGDPQGVPPPRPPLQRRRPPPMIPAAPGTPPRRPGPGRSATPKRRG